LYSAILEMFQGGHGHEVENLLDWRDEHEEREVRSA